MKLMRYRQPQLSTWAPVDRLSSLRDEMNQLFENVFPGFGREDTLFGSWAPALDVFEDNNNVIVKAELPGMKKEDIQIQLLEDTLTISGERKHEEEHKDGQTHRTERYFGRFHRSVALPTSVSSGNVSASYKDGVLTVTLPKAEEAKPKQINVNVD